MKLFTVGLLLLGVVAAVCMALLVASLRAEAKTTGGAPEEPPSEVEILVAAQALPAMSIVDAHAVTKKTVPKEQAPSAYFSDSIEVAGQVLAVPVVEGQVLTRASFVTEGSGKQLAAALRKGMRAVSVSLSNYSGLDGILYPGSVVDVLVTLKLPSENGGTGETVSTTLLQGIQVLGIADRTVVSDDGEEGSPSRRLEYGKRRMITLMVNAQQAVILQLAREHGTVSLAMRNPLDSDPISTDGVLLSELSPEYFGRLAQSAGAEALSNTAGDGERPTKSAPSAGKPRRWEVAIIRGGEVKTRTVLLPAGMAGR